jgi:hypothetical protein
MKEYPNNFINFPELIQKQQYLLVLP